LATKAAASGILLSAARMTGDGFYEAVLKDPDGNPIEITA
jgi:lactoylglutathione lyase